MMQGQTNHPGDVGRILDNQHRVLALIFILVTLDQPLLGRLLDVDEAEVFGRIELPLGQAAVRFALPVEAVQGGPPTIEDVVSKVLSPLQQLHAEARALARLRYRPDLSTV